MKNVLWVTAIAAGFLMSACSHKSEVWTAHKSTSVYASENDGEDDLHNKILFTLDVGDTCNPMREKVMQVYQHTEIQCDKGRGWVIDKQNFDIKSTK